MPADDEHNPSEETQSPQQQPYPELLGAFDAFRARRVQEQEEYGEYEPTVEAQPYVGQPPYVDPPPYPAGRRRWRSVVIFGGVAALAVGLGAGVYASVGPTGGGSAALTAPTTTTTASPTPSVSSKAAKDGKAVTARLTVTAVNTESFTATTARGESVVVQITPQTRFGTAARPFVRAQLVVGAVVNARLRREADGTIAATVIAAAAASSTPPATA